MISRPMETSRKTVTNWDKVSRIYPAMGENCGIKEKREDNGRGGVKKKSSHHSKLHIWRPWEVFGYTWEDREKASMAGG